MRLPLFASSLLLLATPATAQEVFAGLHKHAVDTPLSLSGGEEGGADLSLGYRFAAIGRTGLQPYVLAAVNSAGDTNYAAAGISYRFGRGLYVRPGLGIAVHDGSTRDVDIRDDRIDFGSRWLFAPELGIGYQASERLSVEAHWLHLSHGQVFGGQNPGIDNVGVRLNWRL